MASLPLGASVGGRALVSYDLRPGHVLWHERLLCAHVRGSSWVVLTPELDLYLEDLVDGVEECFVLGPRGGVPKPLVGQPAHRFQPGVLTRDIKSKFLREGADLAVKERGPGRAGELPIEDEGMDEDDPPARPPLPPPASPPTDWVALETRHGFFVGDRVRSPTPSFFLGDRALVELGPGQYLAVGERGSVADTPRPSPPAAAGGSSGGLAGSAGDLRTLAVKYDSAGKRFRDFRESALLLTETPFADWEVKGPRTVKWLVEQLMKDQLTPMRRHQWWRQLLRLTPRDEGVGEHELISRMLEAAMTYDQVNVSELSFFELALRRYQLIEEQYSRRLEESELGKDQVDRAFEHNLFLGSDRTSGRSLVSPKLQEWIAGKLRDEAAILKERRKGR